MASKRIIIQLRYSNQVASAAFDAAPVSNAFPLSNIASLNLDEAFSPVAIPNKTRNSSTTLSLFSFDARPESSSYIMRAEVDENEVENLLENARSNDSVVGIYADTRMEAIATCPRRPVGTDKDVETLLNVESLWDRGLDGTGVNTVIVDTGVNLAYLNRRGKNPEFDEDNSWSPSGSEPVGEMPVGHGTMCGYDVCIAAPKCTLIDHALLTSTSPGGSVMDGLLSDAVRSFVIMRAMLTRSRDEVFRGSDIAPSLVVNNSWGMFHPDWDFPVGHPSNYSDNPDHPFNIRPLAKIKIKSI